MAHLHADGLELCETEWWVDFDAVQWLEPRVVSEIALADQARATGTVQYGMFHTWGHDAPDAV